jgi:hypothetical protein
MAFVVADRVQETATANTTVSFTLNGAVTGFRTFSAGVGGNNTTYYSATDSSGNWEVGIGTLNVGGTTLTRTTILSSSNSGSAVTFSGTVNVFDTYPAARSLEMQVWDVVDNNTQTNVNLSLQRLGTTGNWNYYGWRASGAYGAPFNSATTSVTAYDAYPAFSSTLATNLNYYGYKSNYTISSGGTNVTAYQFYAGDSNGGANTAYAFYANQSQIAIGGTTTVAYQYYAAGSDPNYFAGATTFNDSVTFTSTATFNNFATLNSGATISNGVTLVAQSDPSAPSAGRDIFYAKTIAGGYTAPAFKNPTNTPVQLQSSFGFKKIIQGTVNGAGSAYVFLPASAIGNATVVGTATAISSTNTSFFTRINKFSQISSATAGNFASLVYNSNNQQVITLGVPGTPNAGGFLWVYSFGIGDTVASPRTFVGLSSATAAATNVEPSTLINAIGVGQGAANTNLFVYYGGSAAQTPINLGVNFPTNTSSTDWYQVVLFAPPNSNNTVYYQVTRQNTGDVATGTLTGTAGTALPANTSNLYYRGWRTNNATAAAVTLQYGAMYIETDY